MRKLIIDTDTATDDAAALLIACAQPDTEILAVTTVAGNIPLEKGTRNALMTLETAGKNIPVYPGARQPLYRPLVCAEGVHGKDGLGDRDLVHPSTQPESVHGVTKILELVRAYPGEIEIVALGPATNLALAILQDREAMAGVKHIWSMGTGGFGPGNCTPVAEFNVYVDAEAYQILLTAGIPLTIIGFDMCLGEAALNREDLDTLASGNAVMQFMAEATSALVAYNERCGHGTAADLPDAVAMGCALWPELVRETVSVYAYCCTKEEPSYGQVIFFDRTVPMSVETQIPADNAVVVKAIDPVLFRRRFVETLEQLGK
ncbi:MAG: nucleoside hydrolase [Clostridia bacterium]|nr:nucleoside hydrolase [Clostridia bacterium]